MTLSVLMCRSTIRDKIIPHAVSWFTGEAGQDDDFEDMEDDDEDEDGEEVDEDEEDDEDEDEEDDEDEDDVKNRKKDASPDHIPSILNNIVGRKYTFHLKLTSHNTVHHREDFTVVRVKDIKDIVHHHGMINNVSEKEVEAEINMVSEKEVEAEIHKEVDEKRKFTDMHDETNNKKKKINNTKK